jgi:hypothetical protein
MKRNNSNLSSESVENFVCPGFYYFPSFLDDSELNVLETNCKRFGRWINLSNRKLQRLGGTVSGRGHFLGVTG